MAETSNEGDGSWLMDALGREKDYEEQHPGGVARYRTNPGTGAVEAWFGSEEPAEEVGTGFFDDATESGEQ